MQGDFYKYMYYHDAEVINTTCTTNIITANREGSGVGPYQKAEGCED